MHPAVALSQHWLAAVCQHDPAAVAALYAPNGVLVGTVAQRIKQGRADIQGYFVRFLAKTGLCGRFTSHLVQPYPGWTIHSGTYVFEWSERGRRITVPARYTFVWVQTPEGWKIANHHSSALPE
jgi:uncharacterized protein (TIGR02246 family)